MEQTISFVATGDSFITRRLPSTTSESFVELTNLIKSADARLTNLEITTHNFEGYPGQASGGTWAITSPLALRDIKAYGFNLLPWANNHTLDYLYGGLEATERYINEYEFVHAGVGKNLADASAPRYLETPAGRVALIAATSSFHETWIAGDQRNDMSGRPGINPLRHKSVHKISKEKLETLKEIADTVDINAVTKMSIKEGFVVEKKDGKFEFGQYVFAEGSPEGKETSPDPRDMKRILKSISEAKRQADYVVVSIHAHEMQGEDKSVPAEFLKTFARECIDGGADSIVGHGPHVLRGIEIYNGRPIFYSLGNFIFQNETVTHLPADFYEKYGLGNDHTVADGLDTRTENNTKGFGVNEKIWDSIVPVWKMQGDKLTEVKLYPIELGYKQPRYKIGWPTLVKTDRILKDLQELSEPFGTKIDIKDGVGTIVLD
ncbi:CapA family protein [Ornithinibacillus sp. 4-3]|uniref:CapA family protein n=1 Tax=Ornithinibacillus sp. 4-3 TaxID=3231488 RepID=A0AB39HNK0_9BACI